MPLCYSEGIIAEHLHTRSNASLFDVSHMVQFRVEGEQAASGLEQLSPANLCDLPVRQQTYTFLTNESGGVVDDVMISRRTQCDFVLVANATRRKQVVAHMERYAPSSLVWHMVDTQALLSLQGPASASVMRTYIPELDRVGFMHGTLARIGGFDCYVTRCGYSGEDGFEISVDTGEAASVAQLLLSHPSVLPAGLGARDSLRLEAGLCLYGHELDEQTTPVEAGLQWAIAPARRVNGARAGGFPGADILHQQCASPPPRSRMGCLVEGRALARNGTLLYTEDGLCVAKVSSGGFSPSLQASVAMAYVDRALAAPGTMLMAEIRNKRYPLKIVTLPLVPHNYYRV